MTSAGLPGGQTVNYSYDALGRRASRTAQGATTSFLYDGADVVADRHSDGSRVDYLNGFGVDDKLRQTDGAATHDYLQDHQGSTIALVDADGQVAERQSYEPYGATAGSSLTRYGYTGRELDEQTGLMYYRARWYDPQQGRFISEDPVGFAGGMNFYAYVGNRPVNATDPSGLMVAPYEIADWLDQWIDCLERGLNRIPGMGYYNDITSWWNTHFPSLRVGNPQELAQLLRSLTDMLRIGTTAAEVYRNGEGFWGWAYAVARESKRAADLFVLLAGLGSAFLEARAAAAGVEVEGAQVSEATGSSIGSDLNNPVLESPRAGSGLTNEFVKPVRDEKGSIIREFPSVAKGHGFPDIIDNYGGAAQEFTLRPGVKLYQVEGSYNGVEGRFEWIIDNGQVTHRMFVHGGKVNGVSIKQ